MPRIAPLSVVAAAGGLAVFLAGCTADDPTPLPTAPSSTTSAAPGRLTIQYLGDDGFSGLVFVDDGRRRTRQDQGRSDDLHPPARGLRLSHCGSGQDHGQGPGDALPGRG